MLDSSSNTVFLIARKTFETNLRAVSLKCERIDIYNTCKKSNNQLDLRPFDCLVL